jgi:CheY-like chemotaxis protein
VSQQAILLIEDDADTRDMIGRFLELEGFAVETAANGREALDRLDAGAGACVILLDLMMPVMDGWEFRRRQASHSALAKIPVIVFSAAGRDRMAQIDANDYLSKPVDLDELLERVSRYCQPLDHC